MKQYMPLKPIKRGFKVWVLADAYHRYVTNFQVDIGKSGETSEHGLGGSVVKHLCNHIKQR